MNKLEVQTLEALENAMFNAELMMSNVQGVLANLQSQLVREIDEKNFCSTPSERFGCQENIERLRDRISEEGEKLVSAMKLRNTIARTMEMVAQ